MKLQHFAVIFIIIVLPISFLLSESMNLKIEEVNMKNLYDSRLNEATYDAVKAFEINTANNKIAKLSQKEKEKEVKYIVDIFYRSLAEQFSDKGYEKDSLKDYTPAILINLYDGFYMYSKYKNVENNEYEYGIKPYEYYTCRYKKDNNYDFIVNYTLDNYIKIYGIVNNQIVNKSGYLIDISKIDEDSKLKIDSGADIDCLYYDNLKIEKEILTNNEIKKENSQVIEDEKTIESLDAVKYYIESYKFTKWVNENLADIKPINAVDEVNLEKINFTINKEIENNKIFEINNDNNPDSKFSNFYMHKESVIRKKIENNLITGVANYNQYSSLNYEFVLQKIKETDWEKIINNVSITSFVQGLSIKGKYYNSYATIVSNSNMELINKCDLMVLGNDGNYHKLNCKELIGKNIQDENFANIAYAKQNLKRKKIVLDNNTYYYYPKIISDTKKHYTNCYKCIASMQDLYMLEEVIIGEIKNDKGEIIYNKEQLKNIRKIYYTSIARERYLKYIK